MLRVFLGVTIDCLLTAHVSSWNLALALLIPEHTVLTRGGVRCVDDLDGHCPVVVPQPRARLAQVLLHANALAGPRRADARDKFRERQLRRVDVVVVVVQLHECEDQ